jgi:Ca2+-binding EF-hand superfamily protein
MKGQSMSLAIIVVLSITAHAQPSESQDKEKAALRQDASTDVTPTFNVLDADRNGFISNDEARGLKGLPEAFDAVDENRDGKLDATELSKFLAPAGEDALAPTPK